MAHFQVPDDRSFNAPDSGLKPWPETADGYRLFVSGNGGEERIGIHSGQTVELQLTMGKGLRIESLQSHVARTTSEAVGADRAALERSLGTVVTVSLGVAATDKEKFAVTAVRAGGTKLYATDATNKIKAELTVWVGDFAGHGTMATDLIKDVCRGSDSLRIHALQRMLNNNANNIFEQNATCNIHTDPRIGNMTCGLVAKYRGDQVFTSMATVADDWYLRPIHEPLNGRVTKRTDVKYRPNKVKFLWDQVVAALRAGKTVRLAVLDAPIGMSPVGGKLVAYHTGGHTVLVVGCNATELMYIDPWGSGSMMEYTGGIYKFPGKCVQLGKLILAEDPDRRARPGDRGFNIIREHIDTQGSFNYAAGNFLEVIAAPVPSMAN